MDKCDVRTPDWLMDQLEAWCRKLTGKGFQIDAAAANWNHQVDRYWSKEQDALRQNWKKYTTLFCNPPFAKDVMDGFATKAIEAAQAGSTVVMILPVWTGANWFQRIKAASHMRDVVGIIQFDCRDGTKISTGNGMKQITVATLGPHIEPGTSGEPFRKDNAVEESLSPGARCIVMAVRHICHANESASVWDIARVIGKRPGVVKQIISRNGLTGRWLTDVGFNWYQPKGKNMGKTYPRVPIFLPSRQEDDEEGNDMTEKRTAKDMIEEAYQAGHTTMPEIIEYCEKQHGKTIPKGTVAPCLAKLRKADNPPAPKPKQRKNTLPAASTPKAKPASLRTGVGMVDYDLPIVHVSEIIELASHLGGLDRLAAAVASVQALVHPLANVKE